MLRKLHLTSRKGLPGTLMRKLALASLSHSNGAITYESLLQALAKPPTSLLLLQQLHSLITTSGFSCKSVLSCRLLICYFTLSGLLHARKLFESLPNRTTHVYNHILRACINRERQQLALGLYKKMLLDRQVWPDAVTFSTVLKSCSGLGSLRGGKIVHAHVLVSGAVSDLRLATDIVHFYSKCGYISFARMQFESVRERDVCLWTAMVDGYLRCGMHNEALGLFLRMRECGVKANSVAWNALVAGFARDGLSSDALCQFKLMQVDGFRPDKVSLLVILPLFSQSATLKPGLEAHAYLIRNGLDSDLFIVSALVDLYAKCGKLASARCMFDQVGQKDVGLWNAIIAGYGMHGECNEALYLFDQMRNADVRPNEITFTAVLSACRHAGLVSKGRSIYSLMVLDYKVAVRHEHYASMVDMLGRAGHLEEAFGFIKNMPMEPTTDIWGAFLSACRIHSSAKFLELALDHIPGSNLINDGVGYHVMLSNIYAEKGRWSDMANLRTQIRDVRLRKRSGFSWIEVGDQVHMFHMADVSHSCSNEIYTLLRNLYAVISSLFDSQVEPHQPDNRPQWLHSFPGLYI